MSDSLQAALAAKKAQLLAKMNQASTVSPEPLSGPVSIPVTSDVSLDKTGKSSHDINMNDGNSNKNNDNDNDTDTDDDDNTTNSNKSKQNKNKRLKDKAKAKAHKEQLKQLEQVWEHTNETFKGQYQVAVYNELAKIRDYPNIEKGDNDNDDNDDDDDDYNTRGNRHSNAKKQQQHNASTRRERKEAKHVSIAQLKAITLKPSIVQQHDTTYSDPYFLVYLKSYPHMIQISQHWSQKRNLMANKHGTATSTFVTPDYVDMLEAKALVQQDDKTMRQELRSTARARLNRHNIDYELWRDAFYHHMPPVQWEKLNDLYSENKEDLDPYKGISPLQPLSYELMRALGMLDNTNDTPQANSTPLSKAPPWIIAMQQHGPPPSYPGIYIPGVNAPLPYGARYDTEWGQPPVRLISSMDPTTNQPYHQTIPLYDGDLFGQSPMMIALRQYQHDYSIKHSQYIQQYHNNTSPNKQQLQPIPSLAGCWFPRQTFPMAASPLSLDPFNPIIYNILDTRSTMDGYQQYIQLTHPSLFGSLDYTELIKAAELQIQHEKELQQQQQQQQQATTTSTTATTTTSTTSTSTTHMRSQHSDAAIKQAQQDALPQHLRGMFNPSDPNSIADNTTRSTYVTSSATLYDTMQQRKLTGDELLNSNTSFVYQQNTNNDTSNTSNKRKIDSEVSSTQDNPIKKPRT